VKAEFSSALLQSLAEARAELRVDEADFSAAVTRLASAEWPFAWRYAYGSSPPPPPLLSTPPTDAFALNFLLYAAFKTTARFLPEPEQRLVLDETLGRLILLRVAPAAGQAARAAAEQHDEQAFVRSLQACLEALVTAGYCRTFVLAWGATPDVLSDAAPGGVEAELSTVLPAGSARGAQLRLNAPVDIAGGVALRAEENGWWGRPASAMLSSLFREGGYEATFDEDFLQDAWKGPSKFSDQVLLALGDPLGSVDIPFQPDVLLINVTW